MKILVFLTRDAWQAASRPPILEKQIGDVGQTLAGLTEKRWVEMVEEGLQWSETKNQGYKARGTQIVTLSKSGERVETRKHPPHLSLRTVLWEEQPGDLEAALDCFLAAAEKLRPLYEWVKSRAG